MALYVLSGARGGTTRASNAFSVGRGYQSSVFLAGVKEHVNKKAIRDFADVPDRYVLDKGTCFSEHSLHSSDTRDIPIPNVLVEDICLTEHKRHICDTGDIPTTNILVEVGRVIEHRPHVSDTGDIPTPNILVKDRASKRATASNLMPSGDVRD